MLNLNLRLALSEIQQFWNLFLKVLLLQKRWVSSVVVNWKINFQIYLRPTDKFFKNRGLLEKKSVAKTFDVKCRTHLKNLKKNV